jgi:hypothetical protein
MSNSTFGPPPKSSKKAAVPSKFLPFITDKSSPSTVFKALVQRTKGLSNESLCILFSAVLCVGIKAVKEKVKSFASDTSTTKTFNLIIASYPQFKPTKNELKFWEYVLRNHGISKIKTDAAYNKEETTVFFTCIAKYKQDYLEEINFDLDLKFFNLFSNDNAKYHFKELSIDFTSKENKIAFLDLQELKAYIAYQITINNLPISFYPVAIKDKSKKSYFKRPYEENSTYTDDPFFTNYEKRTHSATVSAESDPYAKGTEKFEEKEPMPPWE